MNECEFGYGGRANHNFRFEALILGSDITIESFAAEPLCDQMIIFRYRNSFNACDAECLGE